MGFNSSEKVKPVKYWHLMLLTILIAAGIMGCGGKASEEVIIVDEQLLGTWEAISVTEDWAIVPLKNTLEWQSGITKQTYEFFITGQVIRRNYAMGNLMLSENGSCTAADDAGTLTFKDKVLDMNYIVWWDAGSSWTLDIIYTKDGKNYDIRFIKLVQLTSHSPELLRTYKVSTADAPPPVTVDGVEVPVEDFFILSPGSNAVTYQYHQDGTLIKRELQDNIVVIRDKGTWASGGSSLIRNLNGITARGYFDAGGASTTFLNDINGTTVRINWSQWGNAQNHPSELIGKWQPVGATKDGDPVSVADFFGWDPGVTSAVTEFYDDGTVENTTFKDGIAYITELGTWGVDSGVLRFRITKELEMSYTVSGNSVSVSMNDGGHVYVLTFTKV